MAASQSGIIGSPSTSILLSTPGLTDEALTGGRFGLGLWADRGRYQAWEVSYFGLRSEVKYVVSNSSQSILARPYLDGTTGNSQAAFLVSHPTFLTGNIEADYSLAFQGVEVGIRSRLAEQATYRFDILLGYRYLDLDENLQFDSSSRYTVAQGAILAGTTKGVRDQFETDNTFHGGQLGLAYRERMRCFDVDIQTRLAIGGTSSGTSINGRTLTTVPNGGTAQFPGGLLAQTSNIGEYRNRSVSVIPELRIGIASAVSDRVRASVGYNLLAWNNIIRASDQIDNTLTQLPPQNIQAIGRPAVPGILSNFIVQGINLGLQFDF